MKESKSTATFLIEEDTSIREVVKIGMELQLKENAGQQVKEEKELLRKQFEGAFLPLCSNLMHTITEMNVPKDFKQSKIKDMAPVLSPKQGQKFTDELFDLFIPSLSTNVSTIQSVRQGGQLPSDIKVGFVSKVLLKLLYRAINTENLVEQLASNTGITWKDDDLRQVHKRMRVG